VLLEIFDFYRQSIDLYDYQWREKHVWFNLAHVNRQWRAVMFASSYRLDLNVTVGPIKPDHIKKILSGPLPFFIDYKNMHGEITRSAHWRMRAALRHHDRVRKIAFEWSNTNFDEFFKDTKCTFPMPDSLVLCFGHGNEFLPASAKLPDTFLGPDPSDSHLRHLRLENVSLASISGFLLSATALTDLFLRIVTPFGVSQETTLLACLQRMPCLGSLELFISFPRYSVFSLQPSTPNNIVSLSKLTRFRYEGQSNTLNALDGISTPSLQEVDIRFVDTDWPSIAHLPRFFNEIEEHYHAVHVTFQKSASHLSLPTQPEDCEPRFNLGFQYRCMESMLRMGGPLSTRLATVEELRITFKFDETDLGALEYNIISWRWFFQQFPCVKVLRIEGIDDNRISRILIQAYRFAISPALEELQLGKSLNPVPSIRGRRTSKSRRKELRLARERESSARMEAIRPFTSKCRLGRTVKVSFRR
jgi:hypothetical protein